MTPLKTRHKQFADAFLTVAHGNATKAARAIGCSDASASVLGSRMLNRPDVQAYLQHKTQKADITTAKILERLGRITEAQPDKITAGEVVSAAKVILQVNGVLQPKQHDSHITVNIGFLHATPIGSLPTASLTTIDHTDADVITSDTEVMPSQPRVALLASGDAD